MWSIQAVKHMDEDTQEMFNNQTEVDILKVADVWLLGSFLQLSHFDNIIISCHVMMTKHFSKTQRGWHSTSGQKVLNKRDSCNTVIAGVNYLAYPNSPNTALLRLIYISKD